ncbi:hypothetical protein DFJ58DRAFT_733356 [Suillus subalutaceus]|uniref:uncharacterized protein n=1 Tax=Suillus subalutaceus TaxID=48586 RepID=UPI001B8670F0|nr:uncharacterized protein DFJ58DRAFT_733356 [Suillus subalutaceus]KAG1839407.1 hypothetical protein DFJ58DRAFT_733356 [Suillus subalutaceus]
MADIVRPPRLDFHLVYMASTQPFNTPQCTHTQLQLQTYHISPNKLVFEDKLDQGFKSLQPAAKFECPPSPTLEENEYFDCEADTDINMGMDVDPIDRDLYVDDDVCEYSSQPNSPRLYFPPSDDESLDNQSVLSLNLGTPAITHDEHHEQVSTSEYIEGGDKQDDERVWDPEGDPEYLSNDAVLEDGPAQEDQSKPEDILPQALLEHPALLNGYLTVFVNAAYRHATHADSEATLTLLCSTIKTCYRDLGGVPPGLDLDNMAHTLCNRGKTPWR